MKAKTLIAVLEQEAGRVLDHIQPTTPSTPPTTAQKSPTKKEKPSHRAQVFRPAIPH